MKEIAKVVADVLQLPKAKPKKLPAVRQHTRHAGKHSSFIDLAVNVFPAFTAAFVADDQCG